MPNAYQTLVAGETSVIHQWRLDESSGNAVDSVGSINGTYNGASPPTKSQAGIPVGGTSVLFNGGGSRAVSYISTTGFSSGGTGFSIEAWVYIASNPGVKTFVCGWSAVGVDSGELYLDASRVPKFYVFAGSAVTITGGGALALNVWHHLVGVAPTSGTAHLYVDGVAQTAGTAIGTPYNVGNTLGWQIGGENNSGTVGADSSVRDATYLIDEVAIYNSGLSGSTVLAHYNAGIPAALATLAVTENPDSFSGADAFTADSTLAITEAPDSAAGAAAFATSATLALTESPDSLSGIATTATDATLAVTEAVDSLAGAGDMPADATLAITEAPDNPVALADLATDAAFAVTEAPDLLAGTSTTATTASLSITEAPDTPVGAAGTSTAASLIVTEAPDSLTGTTVLSTSATLTVTEAPDVLSASSGATVTDTQPPPPEPPPARRRCASIFTRPTAVVNCSSGSPTIAVVDSRGRTVVGVTTYDPATQVATFHPRSLLQPLTDYTATISGCGIGAPVSWSWCTNADGGGRRRQDAEVMRG